MPANKKTREWLISVPLVSYWAVLFAASLASRSLGDKGEMLLPLLVLGGLPMFLIAARAILNPDVSADHELAYKDDMTGLANRRAFLLDSQLALKRSKPGNVGLVLFDVKGLKQINDVCGHQAGDELLVNVAERYNDDTGKMYRIGGDEFAVIVNRPSGETVSAVTRRLDEPFVAEFVTCGHSHEIRVCYGMTSNRFDDSFEPFFRRADDLLMLHKRQAYRTGRFEERRAIDDEETQISGTGTEDHRPPHLRLLS
jgi:diguanylate cyclase (GGDEF)-like protein